MGNKANDFVPCCHVGTHALRYLDNVICQGADPCGNVGSRGEGAIFLKIACPWVDGSVDVRLGDEGGVVMYRW